MLNDPILRPEILALIRAFRELLEALTEKVKKAK